jgi:hypothetical protein
MGQEDRVVADVGAAQVQQPGDVVDGRDQVVRRAGLAHRRAHLRQLARARMRRGVAGVLVDLRRRHRRPVGPGGGDDVEIAAQLDVALRERVAQLTRRRQADDVAVDGDRHSAPDVRAKPVDVLGARRRRDADELDAAAGQLTLGLHPVAAVGEQRGALGGDDQRRHRAGESRRPLARLPALGQVLRQVRVARRNDDRGATGGAQRLLDLLDAKPGR